MIKKLSVLLTFSIVTGISSGKEIADIDQQMLLACVDLAQNINLLGKVNISNEEVFPLFTWGASCAEMPPAGPGKVTTLCEEKSTGKHNGKRIFFWAKSHRGKSHIGYFLCNT